MGYRREMELKCALLGSLFYTLIALLNCGAFSFGVTQAQSATLNVDASSKSARVMPDTLFGIFFEEINHAGAGGLWAELVNNRGFEAGGKNTPSIIDPWVQIGDSSKIIMSTDRTSTFKRNEVALKMEVLCDKNDKSNSCPSQGVGVYNPGFWGMNIELGKVYNVVLYIMSVDSVDLSVSLTSSDGSLNLAQHTIKAHAHQFSSWTKVEFKLKAKVTNSNSRLQITTSKRGTIWLDQVSVMPSDTFKGHGFRKDLAAMLADIKPRFLRFPGGSYSQGGRLMNAFRWKSTVGPWEQRSGHFNDVWNYWTDDGLGFFEFLQLAEDLGALPVWVIHNGISLNDQINPSSLPSFVEDILDGIEFARGDAHSTWGSVRAQMGHPKPFKLRFISIGNQECWNGDYKANYLKFYTAIKSAYPDIKVVTNCDGSIGRLDHPADLYDIHVYTSASDMFSKAQLFDKTSRNGPKAFVSEYAVTGKDAGKGTLVAALAEAGFLMGLERNSDIVEMASCAPLFVNDNDHGFDPDAIVFNSNMQFGTPSYWIQHFFKYSSSAIYHPSAIQASNYPSLLASALTWENTDSKKKYLQLKILNYGSKVVPLNMSISGLETKISSNGGIKTVLTSSKLSDENSFQEPKKVIPVATKLSKAGANMSDMIAPYSLTSFDLLIDGQNLRSTI
ncbi:alpha-L-arabinofuranosidase 1-like protein [Carex littledalei]|uniref:non-reducing end alpha-L-arabinofuranosidase n=1 Tax=Carex littledalei TaxID=544730 RepID=A0A833VED2_9POAL|nr:alpha-L-arabinofuranosidase 1-like protein [Carex littledalei]